MVLRLRKDVQRLGGMVDHTTEKHENKTIEKIDNKCPKCKENDLIYIPVPALGKYKIICDCGYRSQKSIDK